MKLRKFFCALGAAALLVSALPAALAQEVPAFTDMAEVQHPEAVTALVGLDVIHGHSDGAFHPTDAITRAEAAKIIALIMNGGKDLDSGVKETPSFSDIGGHWAEAYIEYCADLGILSGRGSGSFDPESQVTALELCKMALAALGYDPAAYQLTGPRWAEKTDELARYTGLYFELTAVPLRQPVTRDNAVQILYNALWATPKIVVPTPQEDGSVEWQFASATRADGSPSSLLWERFGLEPSEAFPAQPE